MRGDAVGATACKPPEQVEGDLHLQQGGDLRACTSSKKPSGTRMVFCLSMEKPVKGFAHSLVVSSQS